MEPLTTPRSNSNPTDLEAKNLQPGEGNFTGIKNILVEALAKINLSPYERRLLDVVIRKTFGWNKVKDRISLSQFQEMSGLPDRRNVQKVLKRLIRKNLILRTKHRQGWVYEVNQNHMAWRGYPHGKPEDNPRRNQTEKSPMDSRRLSPTVVHTDYSKDVSPENHSGVVRGDYRGVVRTDAYKRNIKKERKNTSYYESPASEDLPWIHEEETDELKELALEGQQPKTPHSEDDPLGEPSSNAEVKTELLTAPPPATAAPQDTEGAKRDKSKGDPRVKELILYFCKCYREKFGNPYMPAWGKDGKLIQAVLMVHDLPKIKALMDHFFKSDDPFIAKTGWTIGVFLNANVFSKLVIQEGEERAAQERREKEKQADREGEERWDHIHEIKRHPEKYLELVLAGASDEVICRECNLDAEGLRLTRFQSDLNGMLKNVREKEGNPTPVPGPIAPREAQVDPKEQQWVKRMASEMHRVGGSAFFGGLERFGYDYSDQVPIDLRETVLKVITDLPGETTRTDTRENRETPTPVYQGGPELPPMTDEERAIQEKNRKKGMVILKIVEGMEGFFAEDLVGIKGLSEDDVDGAMDFLVWSDYLDQNENLPGRESDGDILYPWKISGAGRVALNPEKECPIIDPFSIETGGRNETPGAYFREVRV